MAPRSRVAAERPATLASLPADALAHVCELTGRNLEDALPRLRAASKALAVTRDLGRGVARFLGLELPRKRAGRTTRSQSEDPWRALCNALARKRRAARGNRDLAAWEVWRRLHEGDCATYLARALREDPQLVHHGLEFFAGRTLLFLAAWRDRPRCVKLLLAGGATPQLTDDRGCSPLIVAAWAGSVGAVAALVRDRNARQTLLWRGEPPQRSGCGGQRPYTALQWALRKSNAATSGPEKERFGSILELVEQAIFVPLAGEERVGFVVGPELPLF